MAAKDLLDRIIFPRSRNQKVVNLDEAWTFDFEEGQLFVEGVEVGGGGGLTAEGARDIVGTVLTAGDNITIVVDDLGDTVEINASGLTLSVDDDGAVDVGSVERLTFENSDFDIQDAGSGTVVVSLDYGTTAGKPAEGSHTHPMSFGLGAGEYAEGNHLHEATYVNATGNETIAGIKTFSSDPIIPDEVYGTGWNGSLEPPTKNALYDKIETIGSTVHDHDDDYAPIDSPVFPGWTPSLRSSNRWRGRRPPVHATDSGTLTLSGGEVQLSATAGDIEFHGETVLMQSTVGGVTFQSSGNVLLDGIGLARLKGETALLSATGGEVTISTDGDIVLTTEDDGSNEAAIDLSLISTATRRTFTLPDASGTFALTSDLGATATVVIPVGDGSNVIPTGVWTDFQMPFAGTWTAWRILATKFTSGTTGSIIFDLWGDSFANFPPLVGDSRSTSKPTLSAAASAQDTTITDWTEAFAAGDIFRLNVDSASTVTLCSLILEYTRS